MYEGPVRVIRDVEELPSVQQGEVLVASSTGSTFNVVLPLIGALVTERGGVLSHAAIVSREYGLPGIVGCVGATTTLKTGMRVRVDGDKGEVWTIALVPLADAVDEGAFGGKAVSLGAAIRAGLPVPPGVALGTTMVNRVAAGDQAAIETILASTHIPDARLAVRSSAVGEDSADASFAGQHATKLNVRKAGIHQAVRLVWASARTESALAYRARKGLPPDPKIAASCSCSLSRSRQACCSPATRSPVPTNA